MKIKKMLSRIIVIAMALTMMASVTVSAEEAAADENVTSSYTYEVHGYELVNENFMGLIDEPVQEEFILDIAPFDWNAGRTVFAFVSSMVMVTADPEVAIFEDSPSLVLYGETDVRAWQLTDRGLYPDPYMVIELTFRIDQLSDWFSFCVTELEYPEETASEQTNGRVFNILNADGSDVYSLRNYEDREITTLNKGETYKLSIVFEDKSDKYHFFLNDEYIEGSESKFLCPITQITAFRLDGKSKLGEKDIENYNKVTLGSLYIDTCDFITDGSSGTDDKGDETEAPEETAAPTATPTAEPTATPAPTAEPTATPAPTAEPDDKGCGGVIAGSAAMVALMGIAVVALKKRH